MEWIYLAAVGGAFAVVCAAAVYTQRRNYVQLVAQMRALAERFDLEMTVPEATMGGLYRRNPILFGKYRGRELSIAPKGYGLDNTRQTDIAIRVATRAPTSLRFTVAQQRALDKLGQVGRLKYTPTGDQEFDRAFSLRSNQPELVARFFDRDRRRTFQKEWLRGTGFLELHDSKLEYLEFGLPYEEDKRLHLEQMIELCSDLAEELDVFRS